MPARFTPCGFFRFESEKQMTPENRPEVILRRPAVEATVGLGRSAIYALMAKNLFPKPVKLTAKAVGWRERDVRAWLESREVAA